MSDSLSTSDEVQRLREQLRVLNAENFRLRASAATALQREEQAEQTIAWLEAKLRKRWSLRSLLGKISAIFRKPAE